MKTARLHGHGRIELHDEKMPDLKNGEVMLQIAAVGVCGSDLHWFTHGSIGDAVLDKPLVLGHEFSAVTPNGIRVAVDPALPCGHCEWCMRGDPNLCPQVRFAGHGGQDGALREFMAWPMEALFPLPDSIDTVEGAMLEPLGVAIHAVNLGKLQRGMKVGVFGSGPIGLLTIQLAKIAGVSKVYATDILPHRLEAARSCGANEVFDASTAEEAGQISRLTAGRGLDVVFEFAGEQEAVDAACGAVMPGGKVILGGIPKDDVTTLTASLVRRKGLTIKLVRRMKNTYPLAIELVAKKMVDVKSLVTHRFPLARVSEAYETARKRDGLKVVIEM